MKTFKTLISEASCPEATIDVHVNLENRNEAIQEYGYGPLNPNESSDEFWNKKAKLWGISVKEAQTARCYNCAAFNVSKKIMQCIINGMSKGEKDHEIDVVAEKAGLGYCEMFHFKCAGERTCDAWIVGGPVTDKDV